MREDIKGCYMRMVAAGREMVNSTSRYDSQRDNFECVLLDLMMLAHHGGENFAVALEGAKKRYENFIVYVDGDHKEDVKEAEEREWHDKADTREYREPC